MYGLQIFATMKNILTAYRSVIFPSCHPPLIVYVPVTLGALLKCATALQFV